MLGENVSPVELLQARSPSLDLDSLYGAGPHDPESAKFYEADGVHLKMGKTVAVGGDPAMDGFDLPRGEGTTNAAKRKAVIPDFAQRREPRRRARRTSRSSASTTASSTRCPHRSPPAQRFAQARELATKHYQWMLRHRLPAADLRARRASTTSSTTAARRSRSAPPRPTCRRCRSSSRSPRSGSATR